jgi:transcriptional regulator with XRE-family HTH domain
MTETPTPEPGIGRRIANYRRMRGFDTAKQLADAIPNEKMTASVIQNIESGRKSDLAVSQLLDIARGIGVSPLFLLTPVGRPFDKIDLPGVGADVANMTVHEFDVWLTVSNKQDILETQEAAQVRRIVQWMRSLIESVNSEIIAAFDPELTAPDEVWEDEDGKQQVYRHRDNAKLNLDRLRERVDTLYTNLSRYNVDLSWVERPWLDKD